MKPIFKTVTVAALAMAGAGAIPPASAGDNNVDIVCYYPDGSDEVDCMSALEFKLTCGSAADLTEDSPEQCKDNANVLDLKRHPGSQMTNGRAARHTGAKIKLRQMATQ